MSATRGVGTAALMAPMSRTDSRSGTATRMMSHPAAKRRLACSTLASTSAAGAQSIDWTAISSPPPILTEPICRVRVFFLSMSLSLFYVKLVRGRFRSPQLWSAH